MHLSESDWLFINSLTYKIHSIQDFDKMRLEFLGSLRLSIPFERATFYLADKTRTEGLCDPVGINFTQEQLQEYIDQFEDIDYLKPITSSHSCYVYRETDLFSSGERERTSYYNLAYRALGLHYTLLLGLVYEGEFLASVVLYRTKEQGDFSDADIHKLELLKDHLALRLAQEMGLYSLGLPRETEINALGKLCKDRGLTEREEEVVEHLFIGDTTQEICDQLCIAPTTLKKHITNCYKKLGIGCRAQLYKILNQ